MEQSEALNYRITDFKKAFDKMVSASASAYKKFNTKETRDRRNCYSPEQINDIVSKGSAVDRARLSQYFFETNGLYKRIILHYATFLTYSWILVPNVKNKKDSISDRKISQTYYKASSFCTNLMIEDKCILFAKEILVKGGYYGLISFVDGGRAVIQNLPFEYCRSRFKNYKNIDIVEFDLEFFQSIRDEQLRENILETFPKLIQRAYKQYIAKKGPQWIFLPDDMGIYFNYFEERPFFLDLIPLLNDLDDYKDIDKKRSLQSLKRILVQKVKTDGLQLVFQPTEAEEMHDGVINMLLNNDDIDVLTTYNDIDLLDVSSSDPEKIQIEKIQDLIFQNAGVSKEYFFATTEAGLNYSNNNDLAMMMVLVPKFANFFTSIINSKFEDKKVDFKLLILPLSYYNNVEYTSRAKELAAFGYSFLTPIVSTGLDQTDLTNLKALENDLLEFDEILKPLQSSYTQSGKKSGEPMGDTSGSSKTEQDKQSAEQNQQEPQDDNINSNDSSAEVKEE